MLQRIAWSVLVVAVAVGISAPAADAAFGVQSFTADVLDDHGNVVTQAGATPFAGVTDFKFNQTVLGSPDGNVRNVRVDLPPGLISNPQATPKCSQSDFDASACPANTQVGTETLTTEPALVPITVPENVYNLDPLAGQVSRFGFQTPVGATYIVGGVRDASDYGLFFTISDIPQIASIVESKLEFFGDPGARNGSGQHAPFIRLPTACAGIQTTKLTVTSWSDETEVATDDTATGASGCDQVPFNPSVSVTPDTTKRDSPAGVTVGIHVPWQNDPTKVASSQVKDTSIVLPPGMSINPAAANGLQACTDDQFGAGSHNAIACPAASRVGTASIDTPVLSAPLTGSVYLGAPQADNPYRLFVVTDGFGLSVRLKGRVAADPNTGQLTTTFADTPQVPFRAFTLNLSGGPNATLATPLACGPAATTSSIAPYSGTAPATPGSSFTVDHDGTGGACPAATPFSLGFSAGSQNMAAGAFSPFALNVTRDDGQQFLSGLTVRQPAGLLGVIQSVPFCDESLAAQGACPEDSRVGTSTVSSGAGSAPFSLSGPVYLTGPYGGGPFGLAIAIRALAGPFDLGTVLVRAAIKVDPGDSHLTIETPTLPTVLHGIPLRLRTVNVTIDRPNFLFNPTSCEQLAVGATLTSTEGATQDLSSPFQATGCDALPYAPKMTATTRAAKRGQPAGLTVELTQTAGEANTKSVSVKLPTQVTARLSTISQACPQDTFKTDPASCNAGSKVGTVSATTPVLAAPLTGTVYLAQQGAGKLPTLEAVLQGSGMTISLSGMLDVRDGITSTFAAVPDVPITSFRLSFPPNPANSALAADADLCSVPLKFSAQIVGQNGKGTAVDSPVGVAGCGVQITKATVKRRTATLSVRVPAGGTVVLSGKGVRRVRKAFGAAGTYKVRTSLGNTGVKSLRKALARKNKRARKLVVRLTANYSPEKGASAGGEAVRASRASKRVTFKR